jgi:hypothetical protein
MGVGERSTISSPSGFGATPAEILNGAFAMLYTGVRCRAAQRFENELFGADECKCA